MKKRIKHLWNKTAEPRTERLLLIFLPFLTLVLVALILAPGILSILEDTPLLPPESAATAEPAEAEGLARLPEEELALPVSTPMPAPAPTPEPIIVSESGALLGWQQIAGSTYCYDRNGTPVTGMQTIDGKLYFFDQYGVKAERLGIDVSFYNKFITWPAVAAQGIDFAILRAGGRGWETGLIYDDRWFQRNLAEARNAGIDLGVYFFSTATNPAEAEQEALYVGEHGKSCPTEILEAIASINAEGRPIWKPMHMQPIYRMNPFVVRDGNGRARTNAYIDGGCLDVGMDIFERGLCLPSDNKMTVQQQEQIIEVIRACFG